MPEYVITHGSILLGLEVKKAGDTVTLEEDEAKKMDPAGECLMPKAKAEAHKRADAAAKAELAKVEPPKPEAEHDEKHHPKPHHKGK